MMTTTRVRDASRLSPVREVRDGVRSLERLNDDMLAGGGALLASMIHANRLAGAAPELGQPAIRATIEWLNAMASMREMAIGAHAELRAAAGQVNLREMGWGDLTDCPPTSTLGDAEIARSGTLRVVPSNG